MTAYAKLMSLKAKKDLLEERILDKDERRSRLINRAYGLSGNPMTGMPHAPSGDQDKIGAAVALYIDMEEDTSDIDAVVDLQEEMLDIINTYVDGDIIQDIIALDYIYNVSEQKISALMDLPVKRIREDLELGNRQLERKEVV